MIHLDNFHCLGYLWHIFTGERKNMQIEHLQNTSKTRILAKNTLNFRGNVALLPEIPADCFIKQKISEKAFEAKGALEDDEAFQYYLASTSLVNFETVNLGDEADLMDTVLVFDRNKALPLCNQEVFKNLKDGESVVISKYETDKADYHIVLPNNSDWFYNAKITKKDGQFFLKDEPSVIGGLGFARKSTLTESVNYNTKHLNTLPQRQAEYYLKAYSHPDFKLPKHKKIHLGKMKYLSELKDIFILPTYKNGFVSFMPSEQRGLADLKNGEKVIVGRNDGDEPKNNTKRIDVPLDLAYPTISSEHLVFENINGELYVTDVSRNGTARASRGDSVADYYWEKYFMKQC